MARVEVIEFSRGRGQRDRITEIEVGPEGRDLFERNDPPRLREKNPQTVELSFNQKVINSIVIKGGVFATNSLVNSSIDIAIGDSVNMIPFTPSGQPSEISTSRITHGRSGKKGK